jgi:uncharacterized BrkB/YihY/UPF0761 family membrane protein
MTGTPAPWKQRLRDGTKQVSGQVQKIEPRPLLGFPIATYRRFKEIEGKQLAFVIGGNLFISLIPLFIVGYAIIEAFNPNRSFAVVVIQRFQLHGETADLVRQTFTNARSGRDVAVSISLVSLLLTGFGVATTVQTAYARSFRVAPLRGVRKLTRGAAWLLMLLTVTSVTLTLRYWAHSRPWWFLLLVLPLVAAVDFVFYLVTPRLLTDVPFEWRHLVPGAAICVVAFAIVNAVSAFLMRRWLGSYGRAYGGFGVALAFLSWIGLLATFWVWIGAVAGVWWERFASPKELEEIEAAQQRASRG